MKKQWNKLKYQLLTLATLTTPSLIFASAACSQKTSDTKIDYQLLYKEIVGNYLTVFSENIEKLEKLNTENPNQEITTLINFYKNQKDTKSSLLKNDFIQEKNEFYTNIQPFAIFQDDLFRIITLLENKTSINLATLKNNFNELKKYSFDNANEINEIANSYNELIQNPELNDSELENLVNKLIEYHLKLALFKTQNLDKFKEEAFSGIENYIIKSVQESMKVFTSDASLGTQIPNLIFKNQLKDHLDKLQEVLKASEDIQKKLDQKNENAEFVIQGDERTSLEKELANKNAQKVELEQQSLPSYFKVLKAITLLREAYKEFLFTRAFISKYESDAEIAKFKTEFQANQEKFKKFLNSQNDSLQEIAKEQNAQASFRQKFFAKFQNQIQSNLDLNLTNLKIKLKTNDEYQELFQIYADSLNYYYQDFFNLINTQILPYFRKEYLNSNKDEKTQLNKLILFFKNGFVKDTESTFSEFLYKKEFNLVEFNNLLNQTQQILSNYIQTNLIQVLSPELVTKVQELASQFSNMTRISKIFRKISDQTTYLNNLLKTHSDNQVLINLKQEYLNLTPFAQQMIDQHLSNDAIANFENKLLEISFKVIPQLASEFGEPSFEISSDSYLSIDEDSEIFDTNELLDQKFDFITNLDLQARIQAFKDLFPNKVEALNAELLRWNSIFNNSASTLLKNNDVIWEKTLNYKILANENQQKVVGKINFAAVSQENPLKNDGSEANSLAQPLNQKYTTSNQVHYLVNIELNVDLIQLLNYYPVHVIQDSTIQMGDLVAFSLIPLKVKNIEYTRPDERTNNFNLELEYGLLNSTIDPKTALMDFPNPNIFYNSSKTLKDLKVNLIFEVSEQNYRMLQSMSIAPIDPKIQTFSLDKAHPSITEKLNDLVLRANYLQNYITHNNFNVDLSELNNHLNSNEVAETKYTNLLNSFNLTYNKLIEEYAKRYDQTLENNQITLKLK
ncbi:hypothetical protein [Mycoplasmopsis gallopavonis]|uniref:Lipoprotein n=1 Tax=Mycoplasmopsis gallopavonis TaxID=76629 RepID=A0A449AYS8_9BACT|nr:hypothetical protein [Mycoplasmopsis gallopavonis]RIV16484.1 hypothetical protein D1113_02155 [Mycoplasmopsis gallopavonis]VEU72683.1 Uncharacterised protein [Mycoplasmopsis gallopavonis]